MRGAIGAWRGSRRALAAAISIWAVGSWAQSQPPGSAAAYPIKPVRWVITFDAGTSPDVVGRIVAERLTRVWGQQVVVENRVGAAGVLGTAYVAKAAPDGYTLLQANIAPNAISVSLHAKVPYDQVRDFAPITRIGMTPNIITVHPSTPWRSIK